jgi:hypothetical protein
MFFAQIDGPVQSKSFHHRDHRGIQKSKVFSVSSVVQAFDLDRSSTGV